MHSKASSDKSLLLKQKARCNSLADTTEFILIQRKWGVGNLLQVKKSAPAEQMIAPSSFRTCLEQLTSVYKKPPTENQ